MNGTLVRGTGHHGVDCVDSHVGDFGGHCATSDLFDNLVSLRVKQTNECALRRAGGEDGAVHRKIDLSDLIFVRLYGQLFRRLVIV